MPSAELDIDRPEDPLALEASTELKRREGPNARNDLFAMRASIGRSAATGPRTHGAMASTSAAHV
jgi:hypothetical protein